MLLFEVVLSPGSFGLALLTEETLADTQAQIMTRAEAEKVGFSGLPDRGTEVRYVVCSPSHRARVLAQLDRHPEVAAFDVHDVG